MDIQELYKNAYCSKEAGVWHDVYNWLRQLLGLRYKNSLGDSVAAWGIGGTLGAGAGLAGGKYIYDNAIMNDPTKSKTYLKTYNNVKETDEARLKKASRKPKRTQQQYQNRWDRQARFAYDNSISGKLHNSTLGKSLRSGSGKKRAIAGALALGGLAGTAIYDTLINRH